MTTAQQGQTNYLAGLGAEESVTAFYANRGQVVLQTRFRGKRGEIDLVVRDGKTIVFVEVKRAKTHATAAERVTSQKAQRLFVTAEEYLGRHGLGTLVDTRFDVALVDDQGRVEILENALMT